MSKRLPLSCENCRQRKIRCISSSYQAPCDTCLRRGYSSSCRFRREDAVDRLPVPEPERVVGSVSALEDLLRQNIAVTRAVLDKRNETILPSPDLSPANSASQYAETNTNTEPAHQSGRLIVTPTNHVHFVPSNDLGDAELIDAMHEPTPNSTGFPFFEQPNSNISDELLDMLPPLPQLEQLKAAYFRVFSPLFHVLHDPTFHARYDEFRQNPKTASLPFLALLFIIISVSVTALDDADPLLMHLGRDPSPGANIRALSAKYRAAAMRCLVADNFMFRHNLETVQALVLLIYALNHAQGPVWSLLGTTLHIAVAIGCAVDPARLNVSRIEAEERRRCWAALQMLYTIQNTCLGNLMPFRIDSHVELPADVEDDTLCRPGQPTDPTAPTQMSYLLYKFRLYNLAFDICQLTPTHDRTKITALDTRIAHEQQLHFVRFAARLADLEPHHQAHYFILANYTNHLALLLHRRSLATNQPATPATQSLERCENAATTILSNFERLLSDSVFRSYRWYVDGLGSFYAFFSITTLLILHSNGQINPQTKPETIDLLLRCVDLLVLNAQRSAVCSKAAGILQPVVQHLQVVPVQTPLINGTGRTLGMSGHGHGLGPVPGHEHEAIWDAFPELGNLVFDVPLEQWLSPAGFPWLPS
ncbi:hypothetical protein BDV18DRAFT_161098 [Aspergillus unguis]